MSNIQFCKDCKYFEMISPRTLSGYCGESTIMQNAGDVACQYFESAVCCINTDCLYLINKICKESDCNTDCIFNIGKCRCLLCNCPINWDIEEIKRRLNKKYGK